MVSRMEVTSATVGQRIQAARAARGWSHEKVAGALDIGKSTLIRWEQGQTDPSFRKMVELAELFGKPITWFADNGSRIEESEAVA